MDRLLRRRLLVLPLALLLAPAPALRAQPTPLATPGNAKKAVVCQKELIASAPRFLKEKLALLDGCAGAILKCLQQKPGDAGCLAKAAATCDPKSTGKIAAKETQLVGKILADCADDVLPFSDLTGAAGLGFDAVQARCIELLDRDEDQPLADAVDVAACVAFAYGSRAEDLYGIAQPRAPELARLAGAGAIFPTIPDRGGAGSIVVAPDGKAAKAVVGCGQQIAKAEAQFAGKVGDGLAKCVGAVYGCVAKKPEDVPACLEKARAKCLQVPAKLDAARGKLRADLAKKCAAYETVRTERALQLDALGCECEQVGVPALDTIDQYATCLQRQHECKLADVTRIAVPRVDELLEQVGLELSALVCPATAAAVSLTGGAAVRAAARAALGVDDYVAALLNVTASIGGQLQAGAKPSGGKKAPATIQGVSRPGGKKPAVRNGLEHFELRYRQADPAAAPPTLLVGVRRADGSLVDGYFEVPLSQAEGVETVEVQFSDALRPCAFQLEFTTRDATGTVGADVPAEVEPVVPTPIRTPTPVPTPTGPVPTPTGPVPTPTGGLLPLVQELQDGVGGVDGLSLATDAALSPDGKHLYVVGLGDSAIAVFARDATDGTLAFVEAVRIGLNVPLGVEVSPDGAHVYVTYAGSEKLVTFTRDVTTGKLTFASSIQASICAEGAVGVPCTTSATCDTTPGTGVCEAALSNPEGMAFSPDGLFLYVADWATSRVTIFERTPATGVLTLRGGVFDDVAGVNGLDTAGSLAMSADGACLYVSGSRMSGGSADDAVAVFHRSAVDGSLAFRETENAGGAAFMDGPTGMAISPDGAALYLATFPGNVVGFARNAATCDLTYEDVLSPQGGLIGLIGAFSIAPASDGSRYYVGSAVGIATVTPGSAPGSIERGSDAATTGAGFDVVVSPDDRFVYATGYSYNTVRVFRAGP